MKAEHWLAVLALTIGCAKPLPTSPGCPKEHVMCTPNRGTPHPDGDRPVCTPACVPGESFGEGVGRCDDKGCPVYYLP